ncbi:MAG: SEC-C metal-binding domain-containing protein, partial [Actinomycetota bacterium]|nr:SEC-C metal-binding domain-containing protein [Actinomycetota bacterium]
CTAEGEKVRGLGGLYVLGTERHESRRIDNQLRGRAGRQGDPGESRFYLSLEDDLMRLFATGAMSWVMGKALPDDVPIEAKMVTRAIEKAQSTVEARNAEIRKDVLKYDEVMNQQRKVVYRRRQDILNGADLREEAMQKLDETLRRVVSTFCPTNYHEDWDLPGLIHEVLNYFPTKFTAEELAEADNPDAVHQSLLAEAVRYYELREEQLGPETMREIERRVMLSIIDQRWLEHLAAMDYLQEGINLRAMGQKDPLVEWQRDGFDMFSQMVDAVADDFVRYVMHLNVMVQPRARQAVSNVKYSASEGPVQGSSAIRPAVAEAAQAAGGDGQANGQAAGGNGAAPPDQAVPATVVKTAEQKLGRNQPCWCGSGKKFKLCHGK